MADLDRQVLFENEKFVLGMLHAVSAGGMVAALNQSEGIINLGGRSAFLAFLILMTLALIAALLATYWRYLYKRWDVKTRLSIAQARMLRTKGQDQQEAINEVSNRKTRTDRWLAWTLNTMLASVLLVIAALAVLTIAIAIKTISGV